jgi:hypothetical protein
MIIAKDGSQIAQDNLEDRKAQVKKEEQQRKRDIKAQSKKRSESTSSDEP